MEINRLRWPRPLLILYVAYFIWGYGGWISDAHASPAAFYLLLLTFIVVVVLFDCLFLLIFLYFLLLSFNRH